ncbi:MAG TPA: Co2+/Mg2+ efflux protein ApaG [Mariprofundaceae bacterium]|nr:Co2+/Mg2+ efflux protein ApaG [Mariprofundaceae bacterium]
MSHDSYAIEVEAKPAFLDEQSDPEQGRYVFAYHITIHNRGRKTARLMHRHWHITDGNGKIDEVHGEGVVGEQPVIAPGERFAYSSFAILETPVGCMEGHYDMQAEDGTQFEAHIPLFSLAIPNMIQ